MIRQITLGLIWVISVAANVSDSSKELRDKALYWSGPEIDGRSQMDYYLLNLPKEKIANVVKSVQNSNYPITENTLKRMLPESVRSKPYSYWDGMPSSNDDIAGGRILDYWLDGNTVLRVTIVYTRKSRESFCKDIKVLTAKAAYKNERFVAIP